MPSKNIILLFPNNVLISIYKNNLIIKGPFNNFKKKIFNNSSNDLFFGLKGIQIKYTPGSIFNQLIFLKSSSFKHKKFRFYIHNLIHSLKNYIDVSSTGFLILLQMWGIGYKVSKNNYKTTLSMGYSHILQLNDNNFIFLKPFNNTFLFLTSPFKSKLVLNANKLKQLRKKDSYKGKGIRQLSQKIKLKVGKKD